MRKEKRKDVDINKIIEDAIEYYKSHPDKIKKFLNTKSNSNDPMELYMVTAIKNRIIEYLGERE
jgi:hypothetical protein